MPALRVSVCRRRQLIEHGFDALGDAYFLLMEYPQTNHQQQGDLTRCFRGAESKLQRLASEFSQDSFDRDASDVMFAQ